MSAWPRPEVPQLPGVGLIPQLFDTQSQQLVPADPAHKNATLYVCGITPYDATHLGHAFTYLTYDTLLRAWRDSGIDAIYAQNVTDVDEPLFERANQTGVDWRDLGRQQIALFESDMAALRVLPPDHFVTVTQAMPLIHKDVSELERRGFAYSVLTSEHGIDYHDYYFDIARAQQSGSWILGHLSHLTAPAMLEIAAERGGDPYKNGKRNPLDPCLWRAKRPEEPSWESPLGSGRPGWHIECASIALHYLGAEVTVQGGGADLQFPHHEMSASHALALSGHPLARIYSHSALVSYQGEKMSKSRGNLVFVSKLLADGFEADAVRLSLLQHHYRREWEWRDDMIGDASGLLAEWRSLMTGRESDDTRSSSDATDEAYLSDMRRHLSEDLDTPAMLLRLDDAIRSGAVRTELLRASADALLGLRI